MKNTGEIVSSFDLLTEMFDGINNEKRWISYDGDGLHIHVYDTPSDLLERKVGKIAKPPLLTLRLVEVNGENIEDKTTCCTCNTDNRCAIGVYNQPELERNLDLLEKMLRIRTVHGVSLNTQELETRINSMIKNNEF